MSHIHIQQLASVRNEYDAAHATLAYVERHQAGSRDQPGLEAVSLQHVRLALNNLEDTYIIRLFAEFEGILREHLPARAGRPDRRSVINLIDRVALRHHIPDEIREGAQQVREYRNLLAHQRATGARILIFRDVLARLNRYLAILPDGTMILN